MGAPSEGRLLQDLKVAALFLTRFPVQVDGAVNMRDLAAAVYAFPIMGAAVGLLGRPGLRGRRLGWACPPCPAALLAVAAMMLATGALHEDGLADTADGLGAGGDRERALAIMRDSRIGSFGALALMMALLARLIALAPMWDPRLVAAVLVAAAMASRAVMPVVMLLQPSARATGLAAETGPARAVPGDDRHLHRHRRRGPAAAAGQGRARPGRHDRRGASGRDLARAPLRRLHRRHAGAVQQVAEIAFLFAIRVAPVTARGAPPIVVAAPAG